MLRNPVLMADTRPSHSGDIADLVALAKSGDSDAFARVYRLHVNQVYAFVARRLSDRDAAEEATQEIFTRALEGIGRCRNNDAFSGWLFGIANHVVEGQYRQRRQSTTPLEFVSDPVDAAPGPEDAAITTDAGDELRRAREKCLTEHERALFDLLLADLSDKQIAVALGRRMGAIRTARWRLITKLRGCLNMIARRTGGDHVPA